MYNIQTESALGDVQQELIQLNNTLRDKIGEFLGRNPTLISAEFIEKFNKIREDILSKLPGVIMSYDEEKRKFDLQYTALRSSQVTTSKKQKRKGLGKFPVFIDPKLPTTLLPEDRVKLLEFSNFLSLESEGKKIPEDVLIRATLMIQKRTIAVLENRDSDVVELSKDAKREIRDLARITRVYNFAHGVDKRRW